MKKKTGEQQPTGPRSAFGSTDSFSGPLAVYPDLHAGIRSGHHHCANSDSRVLCVRYDDLRWALRRLEAKCALVAIWRASWYLESAAGGFAENLEASVPASPGRGSW